MNMFERVFAGFTKEYRDKHWQKCRYGLDPRTCESAYYPKGKATEFIMQNRQPLCSKDNLECDARWVE
jgi:hypothetical protein